MFCPLPELCRSSFSVFGAAKHDNWAVKRRFLAVDIGFDGFQVGTQCGQNEVKELRVSSNLVAHIEVSNKCFEKLLFR